MLRQSVSLANTSLNGIESDSNRLPSSRSLNQIIDSRAALDSFKQHWIQMYEIMKRKTIPPNAEDLNPASSVITSDDVTSILNHFDQMVTLLLQESNGMTANNGEEILVIEPNQSDQSVTSWCMVSPLLGQYSIRLICPENNPLSLSPV